MAKRGKLIVIALLSFLAFAFLCFGQSRENGAIEGKVKSDDQALPGVTITISSPQLIGGNRMAITDEQGKFRFIALPPGLYTVEASLAGFSTSKKEGIRLSVDSTLTVDFNMTIGKIDEVVIVKGRLPLIDVKDSQTAVATLSQELIQNLPSNQFVSTIVNMAPGVVNSSAFGASDNGIQYLIDGVDTSDPELHTAYVFLDYGVVEEAKIAAFGLNAEFDGFQGVAFNVVTKSGGNEVKGLVDAFLQLKSWNSKNTDNPDLTPPTAAYYNVHFDIGGPFVKDKLWYFFGAQYYRSENTNAGFPFPTTYDQPRLFFKLSWQPNQENRLSGFIEADLYQGKYRSASANRAPEACRKQDSPELAYNVNYLRTFSDLTFLEAKFSGYTSYYKLIPNQGNDVSGHYDIALDEYSVNYSSIYNAYRTRYQLNLTLNHHNEKLITGSHDFKFGAEIEYNPCKTDFGYAGNFYYRDWEGEPYLARGREPYSVIANNFRTSAYLQDSWRISERITINPGIRFNFYRGYVKDMGTVFTPQLAIAPRLGVNWDIFDDHSTVLKIHYGRLFDNITTSYYGDGAPFSDLIYYYWDADQGTYLEDFRVVWDEEMYTFDKNIRMPYVDQFTVSLEREMIKDLSVGISYIYRNNKDFIDQVLLNGEFEPFEFTDNETGNTYTCYDWLNSDNPLYFVTNPKKGDYPIIAFDPKRTYNGVELVINKRWSNNWQMLASYVYGKARGNNDNWYDYERTSSGGYSVLFVNPNYQINADGKLRNDPTHMVKLQGTVLLPFDIYFSGNFSYVTGETYTREIFVDCGYDTIPILSESFGSRRYPSRLNLDLRLEKQFKIGKFRVSALLDVFNVFNDDSVNDLNVYAGDGFEETYSLVDPRAFRVGARFYF